MSRRKCNEGNELGMERKKWTLGRPAQRLRSMETARAGWEGREAEAAEDLKESCSALETEAVKL